VLRDESRDQTIPETTIIIEYLAAHFPGPVPMLPRDPAARLEARLWDRFFDCYVQVPMSKIVTDRLRAAGEHDPRGVEEARGMLRMAYGMIETRMKDRTWILGDALSIADCSAAPALFYAGIVEPFEPTHPHVAAYFERWLQRASFQRVLAEARPYFEYFPYREAMPARFL
jgi:glutathione S-transferase